MSPGSKDWGYRALGVSRFSGGHSKQDSESVFLDKAVGVRYSILVLSGPREFEQFILDGGPYGLCEGAVQEDVGEVFVCTEVKFRVERQRGQRDVEREGCWREADLAPTY